MRSFKQPTTQAEWDAVKALLRQQRKDKLAGLKGFMPIRDDIKKEIERRLPASFGRGKRLKYKS